METTLGQRIEGEPLAMTEWLVLSRGFAQAWPSSGHGPMPRWVSGGLIGLEAYLDASSKT